MSTREDILSLAVPAGWKLVPIEPTELMRQRAISVSEDEITEIGSVFKAQYRAALAAAPTPPAAETDALTLTYTNWRGETAERSIIPRGVWFGATEWHPEPQWLLRALDVEKQAERDFALKDFGTPPAAEASDLPWRRRDIERGLILFRTSSNAHGSTNVSILSEKVDALPQSAKDELAGMMRNIAIGLSAPAPTPPAAETFSIARNIGDKRFLSWIADRLVNVHGDNENVDFVQTLRRFAAAFEPPAAEAPGQEPAGEDVIQRALAQGEINGLVGAPDRDDVELLLSLMFRTDLSRSSIARTSCWMMAKQYLAALVSAPPTYADAEAKLAGKAFFDDLAKGFITMTSGDGAPYIKISYRDLKDAQNGHGLLIDAIRSLASPAPKGET